MKLPKKLKHDYTKMNQNQQKIHDAFFNETQCRFAVVGPPGYGKSYLIEQMFNPKLVIVSTQNKNLSPFVDLDAKTRTVYQSLKNYATTSAFQFCRVSDVRDFEMKYWSDELKAVEFIHGIVSKAQHLQETELIHDEFTLSSPIYLVIETLIAKKFGMRYMIVGDVEQQRPISGAMLMTSNHTPLLNALKFDIYSLTEPTRFTDGKLINLLNQFRKMKQNHADKFGDVTTYEMRYFLFTCCAKKYYQRPKKENLFITFNHRTIKMRMDHLIANYQTEFENEILVHHPNCLWPIRLGVNYILNKCTVSKVCVIKIENDTIETSKGPLTKQLVSAWMDDSLIQYYKVNPDKELFPIMEKKIYKSWYSNCTFDIISEQKSNKFQPFVPLILGQKYFFSNTTAYPKTVVLHSFDLEAQGNHLNVVNAVIEHSDKKNRIYRKNVVEFAPSELSSWLGSHLYGSVYNLPLSGLCSTLHAIQGSTVSAPQNIDIDFSTELRKPLTASALYVALSRVQTLDQIGSLSDPFIYDHMFNFLVNKMLTNVQVYYRLGSGTDELKQQMHNFFLTNIAPKSWKMPNFNNAVQCYNWHEFEAYDQKFKKIAKSHYADTKNNTDDNPILRIAEFFISDSYTFKTTNVLLDYNNFNKQ